MTAVELGPPLAHTLSMLHLPGRGLRGRGPVQSGKCCFPLLTRLCAGSRGRLSRRGLSEGTAMVELTRRQLYDLIWSKPMRDAAQSVSMSYMGLYKVCRRHQVPTPPY